MAASEANRDLIYYTFKDAKTVNYLQDIFKIIKSNNLNVGNIYNLLTEYNYFIKRIDEPELKKCNINLFLNEKFKKDNSETFMQSS